MTPIHHGTNVDRLREKSTLLVKLGALFQPLLHIARNPSLFDEKDVARALAQYAAEHERLIAEFNTFCRESDQAYYKVQADRFSHSLRDVLASITYAENAALEQIAEDRLRKAMAACDAIPVADAGSIRESRTPFSTYAVIRDLVEAESTRSLVWVDPYPDSNLFHRYLRYARPEVSVTVLTEVPSVTASRRERLRWDSFLSVSELYASERGAARYALRVTPAGVHDRWLVLDDRSLFHLGGSAKDAGAMDDFTVSTLEPTPENLSRVHAKVGEGVFWFGESQPAHLREPPD